MTHRYTFHIDLRISEDVFIKFVEHVSKDVEKNGMQYEIVNDPKPEGELSQEEENYYNSEAWFPYTMFIYAGDLAGINAMAKLYVRAFKALGKFTCVKAPADEYVIAQRLSTRQLERIHNPNGYITRIMISEHKRLSNIWARHRPKSGKKKKK